MTTAIPEEQMQQLVNTYLEDLALKALIERGKPLRGAELSEAAFPGTRLVGDLWRQHLEASQRIAVTEDRHYDLAARLPGAGRTVDGILADVLAAAGIPLSRAALLRSVSSAKGQSVEYLTNTVTSLLENREEYTAVGEDRYALTEWFIDASGGDRESVIMENFLDMEPGFESLQAAVSVTPGSPPAKVCQAVLEAAGVPVAFRVLSFFCWEANPNTFDPVEVLNALDADPSLRPLSPGRWCAEPLWKTLQSQALNLAREAARNARPAVGAVTDLDSLLAAKVPESAAASFTDEEIAEVIRVSGQTGGPINLVMALADLFETYPSDQNFVPAAQAFAKRFNKDPRFVLVGPGIWIAADAVPAGVDQVPPSLVPVVVETQTIDGEPVDALLDDPGLDGTLTSLVRDPYWEDFGEEDEVVRVPQNKQSSEELIYTVLYHHYQAGTMKVRQMDAAFFPEKPRLQRLLIVDEVSGEHEAWLDRENGLIHGLRPLYEARLQPSGSTFQLTRTAEAAVYQFTLRAPHGQTTLEEGRLQELAQLAQEESQRPEKRTLLDLMTDLFILTPKGYDFYTLCAELNVLRRSSKRLVASTLSSYPRFYARKSKSQPWNLDDRKSDQGRLRVVKKHLRK